ncbi:hypothetical protein NKG05_17845 [Oerskovia sp. M15]
MKEHHMSRRTPRFAAVSAALLVLGALSASPAVAETPDLTSKGFPVQGEVCSVVAHPVLDGQDLLTAPAPTRECFDSIGEAIEAVTGEPVTDPRVLAGDRDALREFASDLAEEAPSQEWKARPPSPLPTRTR